MTTKEVDQASIDAISMLLDKNLADVADLPEYLDRVPNGFYHLKVVEVESKGVEIAKEKGSSEKIMAPVIQMVFEIVECKELEDESKEKPKPGGRFNESFFLHNEPEKAIESIKAKYKEVAEKLKIENVLVLVQTLKGMDIFAKVKTVADKKKEDTFYIRVSNAQAL